MRLRKDIFIRFAFGLRLMPAAALWWLGVIQVQGAENEGQPQVRSYEVEKEQIWMSVQVGTNVTASSDVLKVRVVNKSGRLVRGIIRSYRYRAPITIRIVDESKKEVKKTKEGARMFGLTLEEMKKVDHEWLLDVQLALRNAGTKAIGVRQEHRWEYPLLKLFALKPGQYSVSAGISIVLQDGNEADITTDAIPITVTSEPDSD